MSAEGIVIEEDAWIGAGAIILDGVRVGRNGVIGAGSVVTRDVPDYGIAIGAPAEIVGDTRNRHEEGSHKGSDEHNLNMMPSVFQVFEERQDKKKEG